MIRKFLIIFLSIAFLILTSSIFTNRAFPQTIELNPTYMSKILKQSSTYTEKKEKEVAFKRNLFLVLFFVFLTVWFFLLGKWKKDFEKTEDLIVLVGKFLSEENCEELEEILIPVISLVKEDTFLIKSLADCYLEKGKFIEAAALYEKISEIFKKKGFDVLSDTFRKRAEELLNREFRRG